MTRSLEGRVGESGVGVCGYFLDFPFLPSHLRHGRRSVLTLCVTLFSPRFHQSKVRRFRDSFSRFASRTRFDPVPAAEDAGGPTLPRPRPHPPLLQRHRLRQRRRRILFTLTPPCRKDRRLVGIGHRSNAGQRRLQRQRVAGRVILV